MPATGPRADRGRDNAGETAEYIDLAAPGLDPSYLASPVAIVDAESSPLRHTNVARSSPHTHTLPAQTTRKLTMEVATTSQMLFCNIIFE